MSQNGVSESLHMQLPERQPLRALPPDVAERIAAGEVIERPVSVVKELIENALDAAAQEIRIDIRGGGLRLIRVTDDGIGIPLHEMERVIQRHTTSKVRLFADLSRLHTLGFRGEALASIAAISETTVLSQTIEAETQNMQEPASFIAWRGGEVYQQGKRARSHGTTVTVTDLFYNVPARLSHVQNSRSENSHIAQLLRRFAIGYPSVRFRLFIDDRTVLQTSGSSDLATTLQELYRLSVADLLQPVDVHNDMHFTIAGYLGNRALVQANRQHITLFINGRWNRNRVLLEALEQGYRPFLPRGKHPLLALNIVVPPDELDVNVHPSKMEVHLLHEKEITEALMQAMRQGLERSPIRPEASLLFPGPFMGTQQHLPGVRRRGLHVAETAQEYQATSGSLESAQLLELLRPLAQLQQALILAESPDGSLYLVDQHRAHERIIYEHLLQMYSESASPSFVDTHFLLEPVVVEMNRAQAQRLEERLPLLQSLGLACERFGGHSFLIRAVPASEGIEQLVSAVPELVEIAAEDHDDWRHQLLIGLACRSALRRGRALSLSEQQMLLRRLASVSAPAVCPHGSPILLYYSRAFLADTFSW